MRLAEKHHRRDPSCFLLLREIVCSAGACVSTKDPQTDGPSSIHRCSGKQGSGVIAWSWTPQSAEPNAFPFRVLIEPCRNRCNDRAAGFVLSDGLNPKLRLGITVVFIVLVVRA